MLKTIPRSGKRKEKKGEGFAHHAGRSRKRADLTPPKAELCVAGAADPRQKRKKGKKAETDDPRQNERGDLSPRHHRVHSFWEKRVIGIDGAVCTPRKERRKRASTPEKKEPAHMHKRNTPALADATKRGKRKKSGGRNVSKKKGRPSTLREFKKDPRFRGEDWRLRRGEKGKTDRPVCVEGRQLQ